MSQIADKVVFITVSFYGVRPAGAIMIGRLTAKVVLPAMMIPSIIRLLERPERKLGATG